MFRLEKQTITYQEITLDNNQVNALGYDLILDKCKIVIDCTANNLLIARTKFLNCEIVAKRQLTNFRWLDIWIQGCTFQGKFRGNDFGHWPPVYASMGGIQDCDFSKAILDACRFITCDIETIQLPTWPCFTVLHPRQHALAFKDIKSSIDLSLLARVYAETPDVVTAATEHAPQVLKRTGGNKEELKAALESLDFVYL